MAVRKYWTWAQIRAKIRRDLDLESETFVRPEELLDYVNEAIDEAEAEIHAIYEDYFLTRQTLSIVNGQEEYDLPSDIYAHKIRRIMYNNTSSVYTVDRLQDWKKFEAQNIARNFSTSDLYQYFFLNQTAGSPKILLVPQGREDGPYLEVWYLRQANRLELDTDICDIPEFYNFIFQYMKVRIYEKEGHPNMGKAIMDLEKQRSLMTATLAQIAPDAQNEIEMDASFYEEMN